MMTYNNVMIATQHAMCSNNTWNTCQSKLLVFTRVCWVLLVYVSVY